jgi:hypothetical protein
MPKDGRLSFSFFPLLLLKTSWSAERLQLAALHLHKNRVVHEAAVMGAAGLELHVAVGVRHEVVRRRGLAVDEDAAELLGDDGAAAC